MRGAMHSLGPEWSGSVLKSASETVSATTPQCKHNEIYNVFLSKLATQCETMEFVCKWLYITFRYVNFSSIFQWYCPVWNFFRLINTINRTDYKLIWTHRCEKGHHWKKVDHGSSRLPKKRTISACNFYKTGFRCYLENLSYLYEFLCFPYKRCKYHLKPCVRSWNETRVSFEIVRIWNSFFFREIVWVCF